NPQDLTSQRGPPAIEQSKQHANRPLYVFCSTMSSSMGSMVDDLALTDDELALRGLTSAVAATSLPRKRKRESDVATDASKEVLPHTPATRNEIKLPAVPEPRVICTAFPIADLLGGAGLLTGRGIVEITGEASSGKTQLLLDIALSCTRKVAYVFTEGRFPGQRLGQLATYKGRWPAASTDRILVSVVADLEHLKLTLNESLPRLLTIQTIDAVIVDSITWPFRVEDGSKERTKCIQDVVRTLHHLSKKYNVLVVCANHVAADLSTGCLRPCLGVSWSKGISGRLLLTIKDRERGIRSCRIDWCEDYLPWKVGEERDFQIRSEGLVPLNVPETEEA
ncbi:DNA repair and recombination protein radA-like, partial [Tropilaelaps mercedesae]